MLREYSNIGLRLKSKTTVRIRREEQKQNDRLVSST